MYTHTRSPEHTRAATTVKQRVASIKIYRYNNKFKYTIQYIYYIECII